MIWVLLVAAALLGWLLARLPQWISLTVLGVSVILAAGSFYFGGVERAAGPLVAYALAMGLLIPAGTVIARSSRVAPALRKRAPVGGRAPDGAAASAHDHQGGRPGRRRHRDRRGARDPRLRGAREGRFGRDGVGVPRAPRGRPDRGAQGAHGAVRRRRQVHPPLPPRGGGRAAAQPRQHRAHVRARQPRDAALHGDGVRRRAGARGLHRIGRAVDRPLGPGDAARRRGAPAHPPGRHHPPRHQARQRDDRARRRGGRGRRPQGPRRRDQAHGLRHRRRQGALAAHHDRRPRRHPGLHVARAGARPQDRPPLRHLLVGVGVLRDAHGPDRLQGRVRGDRPPADLPDPAAAAAAQPHGAQAARHARDADDRQGPGRAPVAHRRHRRCSTPPT